MKRSRKAVRKVARRAAPKSAFAPYSEKNMSPIIKFGIVFFWVAVIVTVAAVVKMYL